jgi:anti-anti-sigma factor
MERVSVDLRVPGVALVSLSGEHELYDAVKLRERICSLLDGGRSIVVDLTETVFMDSTIVGVLLDAKKLASEWGLEYSVVLGNTTGRPVRRMFDMAGLGGILPVVERDESAPRAPEA